jgi:hypothetical protein
MKSSIFIAFAMYLLTSGVFAQTNVPELKTVQKELKRNLIKHTSAVYGVDFNGCRASIKYGTSLGTFDGFGGSAGYVGGGWPMDEASNTFSAGPGQQVRISMKSVRYELDLTKLDPLKIEISPANRKRMSRVTIGNGYNPDSITIKRNGRLENQPIFAVVSKTKSAEKVANALRAAIILCSTTH